MTTSSSSPVLWPIEFGKVISCARCSKATDINLMRDADENVPQPGYIGEGYARTGLLLVGQNPYLANSYLAAEDREYTAALRALRDAPTAQEYARLQSILARFIPRWPVQNRYFPLSECGLRLEDIAYVNLVRCRTGDTAPNTNTVKECRQTHFEPWVEKLNPICVVFIGLWAFNKGRNILAAKGIPCIAINRNRFITAVQREANRLEVANFVRQYLHLPQMAMSDSMPVTPVAIPSSSNLEKDTGMDPRQTLKLLDELQKLGFSGEAFGRLHHHRLNNQMEPIARFRAYCGKTSKFIPDSNNERVYQRLRFVLNAWSEPDNTNDFTILANAAFEAIPPRPQS